MISVFNILIIIITVAILIFLIFSFVQKENKRNKSNWTYNKQYAQKQIINNDLDEVLPISDNWSFGGILKTTNEKHKFGVYVKINSSPYDGDETKICLNGKNTKFFRGNSSTQVMLVDVNQKNNYQSSTRYLSNTVFASQRLLHKNKLNTNVLEPLVLDYGTFDPHTWNQFDTQENWEATLGGGLYGPHNCISRIHVVKQGKNYSRNTKVIIEGNGHGAIAVPVIIDGQIKQIHVIKGGKNYTHISRVVIKDKHGHGCEAVVRKDYVKMEGNLSESILLQSYIYDENNNK